MKKQFIIYIILAIPVIITGMCLDIYFFNEMNKEKYIIICIWEYLLFGLGMIFYHILNKKEVLKLNEDKGNIIFISLFLVFLSIFIWCIL